MTVLFDDYRTRPPYAEVERLAAPVELIGRMARFELTPGPVPKEHLDWIIATFAAPDYARKRGPVRLMERIGKSLGGGGRVAIVAGLGVAAEGGPEGGGPVADARDLAGAQLVAPLAGIGADRLADLLGAQPHRGGAVRDRAIGGVRARHHPAVPGQPEEPGQPAELGLGGGGDGLVAHLDRQRIVAERQHGPVVHEPAPDPVAEAAPEPARHALLEREAGVERVPHHGDHPPSGTIRRSRATACTCFGVFSTSNAAPSVRACSIQPASRSRARSSGRRGSNQLVSVGISATAGCIPSRAATSVVPELPQPTTKAVASGSAIGATSASRRASRAICSRRSRTSTQNRSCRMP